MADTDISPKECICGDPAIMCKHAVLHNIYVCDCFDCAYYDDHYGVIFGTCFYCFIEEDYKSEIKGLDFAERDNGISYGMNALRKIFDLGRTDAREGRPIPQVFVNIDTDTDDNVAFFYMRGYESEAK